MNEHKLYLLLIDSFNRNISAGGCIRDWAIHIEEMGCKIMPNLNNMMMSSMGFKINNKRKKIKGYVCVSTSSFGNIQVPEELALKSITLNFIP